MMPEQQWPENVRDAVRQVIHDQMPGMMCGPLGHEFVADAVLAALAPHVVPAGDAVSKQAVLVLAEAMHLRALDRIETVRTEFIARELRSLAREGS